MKSKLLCVKGEIYKMIVDAAEREGIVREDGKADPSEFLNKKVPALGFDSDDLKFLFKVPKFLSAEPEKLRQYLHAQVDRLKLT